MKKNSLPENRRGTAAESNRDNPSAAINSASREQMLNYRGNASENFKTGHGDD